MKIVFLDEYSLAGRDLTAIKQLGEYIGYAETTTREQTIERCRGAEVVISNKVVLDEPILAELHELRLICVAATGMNNVDLAAAADRGIEVRNAVGYSTDSVAEATLGAALTLLRQSLYYDRFIKGGGYSLSTRLFCFDRPISQIKGAHWGIIGMGNIGRRVAQLATTFGAKVSYYSTSGVKRDEGYEACATLDELLSQSDIVSLHSPLNNTTADLISAQELMLMKPSAILINVARGGIVNEQDLATALESGTIAAAASDVFAHEPIEAHSPLLTISDSDKLLLSPHTAWSSTTALDRLVDSIAKNIIAAL